MSATLYPIGVCSEFKKDQTRTHIKNMDRVHTLKANKLKIINLAQKSKIGITLTWVQFLYISSKSKTGSERQIVDSLNSLSEDNSYGRNNHADPGSYAF
jgi:hypothetical protein